MESFPVKFCKNIRSHWRRSRYQRSDNPRTGLKVIKLSGDKNAGRWRMRVRRALKLRHLRVLSPARLLARLRDAYVDAMFGFARRNAGLLTGSSSAELFSAGSLPRPRKATKGQEELERKLVLEICRSLAASREITCD